jgi:hypothetical protein
MYKHALFLALVAGLTLPLSSQQAQAATTATAANPAIHTILNLQGIETVAYRTTTAFYLFSVLNRDPQQFRKMQTLLTEGDGLINKAANPALTLKWGELKKACTSARFTTEGVAETASLNAVDVALNNLALAVRSNINEQRTSGKVAVDKMADMLYDQYVTMQIMTSAYLRDSADYFGGGVVFTDSDSLEIDKMAAKFDSQLNQLNKHYSKNTKIAPLLKDITTRWVFVRKSFINYNEKNVPFVVGRYNEQITNKLLQAYALLL